MTIMTEVSFDKRIVNLLGLVTIGFTKSVVTQIDSTGNTAIETAKLLSSCKRLVITPGDDESKFFIHTPWGIFFCVRSDVKNHTLSAIGYKENNIYDHNKALKYGIIFDVLKEIKVIFWDENENVIVYTDGTYGDSKNENEIIQRDTIDTIFYEVSKYVKNKENKKNEINDINTEELEQDILEYGDLALGEILSVSEQYSILSSEIEYKAVQEQGRFIYTNFRPSIYERTDRIAYDFFVRDIESNVLKEGVQVCITDVTEKECTGEIAQIITSDEDESIVTILFNRNVNYDSLNRNGWISLSYSTVNRDVQLKANQNIRNGLSKARYFKSVLGENSPQGFDEKDVSDTMNRLKNQKYVPNDSQLNAIEKGINAKDIFLVMGPPGTGKTTVILEWVKYFVFKENKRVLISSQNNKAVDNVLARLEDEDDIEIIRIGSELKIQSDVVNNMFENKVTKLRKELKSSSDKSIEIAEEKICVYEKILERLLKLQGLHRAFEQSLKIEKNNILETISEDMNLLKKLNRAYEEKKRLFNLINVDIVDYKRTIMAYEASDFLGKMRLKSKYNEAKKKLENAIEYNEYVVELNDIAFRYNLKKAKLDEKLDKIKEKLYAKFAQIAKRINEEKNSIISEILSDSGNTALKDYEDDIRVIEQYNEKDINSLVDRINVDLQNAKEYYDCLKAWKDGVVDNQNYSTDSIILDSVNVVGATCIGVCSQSRFADLDFDVTIIDEAGQIQIHNALVPMSVSNKVIMLGDYKQIPPSVEQELITACNENGIPTEYLKKSLFEVLYNNLPDSNKIMLDTQYRMPGEIADIISEWFYSGQYKSFSGKRGLKSIIPDISSFPFIIVDTSTCNRRYEERTDEGGTFNILEAEICANIVRYAIENNNCDYNEIGVISAYKAQVGKIKHELKKKMSDMSLDEIVATLDSFQGQERDLILYSFTKSSNKKSKSNRIGFLNELRRLNVAMSRCKKTLVLIGDMEFLSSCEHQDIDEDGNRIYEQSEKEFSDFIKFMISSVKNGKGEIISYSDVISRIKYE